MGNQDVIIVLKQAIDFVKSNERSMLQEASLERERRAREEAIMRIEGLISSLQMAEGADMTTAEVIMKIVATDSDDRKRRVENQLKQIREAMNAKKRRKGGTDQKQTAKNVQEAR